MHCQPSYAFETAFWASMHPCCTLELCCILLSCTLHCIELPCTLLSFTASFCELRCTLWATLHPLSYAATHWAAPVFYRAITLPNELHCTLLSYDAACWATLSHPTELCCTLLNYTAPSEQCCTLLSHGALYWATLYPLSFAAPYWAKLHPAELHSTLTDLRCTLLSYAEHYWAVFYCATLFSTELRITMVDTLQPNWDTFSTRTFVQFCQMPDAVEYRNKGTPRPIPKC